MKVKFIEQGSAKDGKTVVDIPANPYLAFLLRLRGTTDTGQTLALADIGDLRMERKGEQIHAESFEFYHQRADLKRGFPLTVTGNAATAEDVVALIPCFVDGLPNVLDVFDKEEVDITLDFDGTTLTTRFGSNAATYELYGIVEEAVSEKYTLDVRQQNVQASASGRLQEVIDKTNIAQFYFEDPSDVVDEITVTVDDSISWDNIDQDVITILTNLTNRIETSGNTLGELNMVETGDIREAFNQKSQLDINFNASGTLNVTLFSVKESVNAERSRARRARFLGNKNGNFNRGN